MLIVRSRIEKFEGKKQEQISINELRVERQGISSFPH